MCLIPFKFIITSHDTDRQMYASLHGAVRSIKSHSCTSNEESVRQTDPECGIVYIQLTWIPQ